MPSYLAWVHKELLSPSTVDSSIDSIVKKIKADLLSEELKYYKEAWLDV